MKDCPHVFLLLSYAATIYMILGHQETNPTLIQQVLNAMCVHSGAVFSSLVNLESGSHLEAG